MIGFRVDANNVIALGHLTRCLTIAAEIEKMGHKCLFLISDNCGQPIIDQYGFTSICLNSNYCELDKEIVSILELINIYKIKKLIVDSYYVTENYLSRLMKSTKVIYIDDMDFFQYPVSMVINYNLYSDAFKYEGNGTKFLLGCRYVPLRDEFRNIKYNCRDTVRKILITAGGSDQLNVGGKLLNFIKANNLFRGIEFHIIVGRFSSNYNDLYRLAKDNKLIKLHKNIKIISKLMTASDIAITAGGITLYELSACGIPTICFSFSENQINNVKSFEQNGLMLYAGDMRVDENECISSIISYIQQLINSPEERNKKSLNMRSLVDGLGSVRIANSIICL